jgi:hypothetical protein
MQNDLTIIFPFHLVQVCQLQFSRIKQNPLEYNYDPQSVAVGDFNNDLWTDFVVSNRAVNNISVFLGSENGTFTKSNTYFTGTNSGPCIIVVGHFNDDQHLDIAVANFDSNSIGIFLGWGNGSFQIYTVISTGSSRPIWLHIADLNDDTLLDIVTANYGHHSISIFTGHGNGKFSHWITYPTGYDSFPTSVITADFNNDNFLDLAVANSGTNNIGILFANGNGTFSNQKIFSTGRYSNPHSIATGYFDQDIFIDIVVTNGGTKNVAMFINDGNGSFVDQIETILDSISSPYFIAVGDINNDKQDDLIVTNRGINQIDVLTGRGDGSFSKPIIYSTGSISSISLVLYDLNKDNLLDMIVINNDTNSISIFYGDDKGFQSETHYSTSHLGTLEYESMNDFTRDSLLDIVDTNHNYHNARISRQYGEPICSGPPTYLSPSGSMFVAVGDLNNDTHLDIVVTNTFSNVGVFLGHGNGSFENQIMYSTSGLSQSLVIVDLNNDNRLDIIVACFSVSDVVVFLGYGNGSFANMTTHSVGSWPLSVAVGDINSDKQLDIIVANSADNNVGILLGYGNGSFANQITYPTGNYPLYVAVADFNNDNQLDIVVINGYDDNIGILLGYGNSSFANQTTYPTSTNPTNAVIGDLNSDSQLDIVVSGSQPANYLNIFLSYGNGSFQNPIIYSTNSSIKAVSLGDFDDDDLLDLVVTDFNNKYLRILRGYGNGSFENHMGCLTLPYPWSTAVGDFNEDHRLDIVVTNYGIEYITVFILLPITFSKNETTIASGGGSRLNSTAVNDFNNDTILDIVVVNYGSNNIGVLLGHGDGSFNEQMMFSTGSNSNPCSVTIGDFNKDDKLDLAVANTGTNNVDMFLGDGMGKFTQQAPYGYDLRGAPAFVLAEDFDHDGQSEILVAYNDLDQIDILVVYDTGNFTEEITYPTGSSPYFVAVADFNNDNQSDIIFLDDNINVLLGYGNGSFLNLMIYSNISFTDSLVVGDFNHDTYLDIVFNNHVDKTLSILFGFGNGSFSNLTIYSIHSTADSLAVDDFNNDTHPDIVFARSYDVIIGILFGFGNGFFSNPIMSSIFYPLMSIAVGDFNNDTLPDIIVPRAYSYGVDILLNYGNGSFEMPPIEIAKDFSNYVAVGHFDNDGNLDIVIGIKYHSYVGVYLGYGNGSFADETRYSVGCSPTFILVADINNDTNLDIITANQDIEDVSVLLGYGNGAFMSQTKYSIGYHQVNSGSLPYPMQMYLAVGDFNNDTQLDMVFISNDNYYTDKNIHMLFGDFQRVFNYERKLITGNGSRPRAFVTGNFNNDTHIDIAVVNSGTNNMGIFLGYGNGSFTNQTTYPTGSSPRSIAAGHFNNDTYVDIVVANYDDSTIVVFLGQGDGSFTQQTTHSTGIDSQPYSIVIADFNNDTFLDIIVVSHGFSTVLVFIGHGNGNFSISEEFSMGYNAYPMSIAVGDFNRDKKLDFAVVNYGIDDLEVWLQTC